jgi:hypothetical protein
MSESLKLKWFILDLGNNYFTDYIDFKNMAIELKDNKKQFMINFKVYDNLIYNTSYNDFKNYTQNKNKQALIKLGDLDILFNPKELHEYFMDNILNNIIEELTSNLNNNIDTSYNIEMLRAELFTIPVFETSKTKYICICNFNRFLSRCLKFVNNISNTPKYHILHITPGITKLENIDNLTGYTYNLMKSMWISIINNNLLLTKEYKINKFKYTLGNLIYSMMNKFPDFYIIFKSSRAFMDIYDKRFISNFKFIENKTKRAKLLNKTKKLDNLLLIDLLKTDSVNFVDKSLNNISFNLDNLSLDDKQKKKYNKKCIKTKFSNITDIINDKQAAKKYSKNIHSICKYTTGSKKCYYSGYKDMINNFTKFNKNLNNSLNITELNNDLANLGL